MYIVFGGLSTGVVGSGGERGQRVIEEIKIDSMTDRLTDRRKI